MSGIYKNGDKGYNLLEYTDLDRSKVHINDVNKLDKESYCRLDILAAVEYSSVDFLPMLLDWNCITDQENMNIGDIIEIPEMNDIITFTEPSTILEDENFDIPGIIDNDNITVKTIGKTGSKTVANTKLNIIQESASYDNESGILTF